jgi:hypothetical protein
MRRLPQTSGYSHPRVTVIRIDVHPAGETIRKTIKSPAQYRAETGPRLQPIGHGGLLHRSAEKPVGPRPGSPAQWGTRPAWPAATRGGVLAGCSAVARRQQGVAGDLEGVTGKVPGKQEGAGAHRNGGSTVRREESSVTVAFASGEGAPVVMVECDEVLQLWRVKWVRKLQENVRIGGSGRSSPGNGGRWRRSAGIQVREGLPVTEGSGLGVGSGWERCGA